MYAESLELSGSSTPSLSDGGLALFLLKALFQWAGEAIVGNIPVIILQVLFTFIPRGDGSRPDEYTNWGLYTKYEIPRKLHHIVFGTTMVLMFEFYPRHLAWRSMELMLVVMLSIGLLKRLSRRFNQFYSDAAGPVLREYEKSQFVIPNAVGFYGSTYLLGFFVPYHTAAFCMYMMVLVDPACAIGAKFMRPYVPKRPSGFDWQAFVFGSVIGTLAAVFWFQTVLATDRMPDTSFISMSNESIVPATSSSWCNLGATVGASICLGTFASWAESFRIGPLDDNLTIPVVMCLGAALFSQLPWDVVGPMFGSILKYRFKQIFTN